MSLVRLKIYHSWLQQTKTMDYQWFGLGVIGSLKKQMIVMDCESILLTFDTQFDVAWKTTMFS